MINVLIVDDKPSVYIGLKKLIPWSELDAQVIGVAGNGKEAFDFIMENQPDVVITDVRMPIMDGLELCRKIHETMPHIFTIILSAYDDFSYAKEAIQYGVTDYVLKPIDYDKIHALTEKIRYISQRRQTSKSLYSMIYDPHLKGKIFETLKNGDMEAVEALFENSIGEAKTADNELVNNWFLKLFTLLLEFTDDIGFRFQKIGVTKEEAWSKLMAMNNLEEMNKYIKELYLLTVTSIQERRDSRSDALVEAVKKMIAERYSDLNLTVNTIADEIHVTPNYISTVFYQKTGEHISSSITELRINKAKMLLKNPGISIHQAAVQCGYLNAHYFSRVFKKAAGLTPSQYRNLQVDGER